MSSEKLVEAALTAEAWVNRWADHVGNYEGGNRCTCGRTCVLYELRQALAAHEAEQDKQAKDAARLLWCYSETMSRLVKPTMTFEEWITRIDAALSTTKQEEV